MNIRRITSLTASLSFVMMAMTSIILFIVPQERVAYWADWRLWGLTKTEWGNIHINLGLLFLISLLRTRRIILIENVRKKNETGSYQEH